MAAVSEALYKKVMAMGSLIEDFISYKIKSIFGASFLKIHIVYFDDFSQIRY